MIEHKFDASKAITLEEILGKLYYIKVFIKFIIMIGKKNKSPIATGG